MAFEALDRGVGPEAAVMGQALATGDDAAVPTAPPPDGSTRVHCRCLTGDRWAIRPIPDADCQIAAIARARDAALATRNAEDFAHCGIAVINPWAASAGS